MYRINCVLRLFRGKRPWLDLRVGVRLGLRFGGLLAGSMLVEAVFSVPGIGRFMVDGVLKRDYPVVQGTVLVLATTFVLVNLAVDLIYALIDPRIKYD